ncbi:hypothetical protein [Dethiothermospora halolimnae]|uniref:hypothetical protein n=1 Tax=Dethiothermospora halolimnae TaxID=3114390 RepID=UPI003CCB8F30
MKRFQSFKGIEDYLKEENIPYEDNKDKILRNMKVAKDKKEVKHSRLPLVGMFALALIIMVAFKLGRIPEHEEYVKNHRGNIRATLSDDMGNIVIQLGVMDRSDYEERRLQERKYQMILEISLNPLKINCLIIKLPYLFQLKG